MKDLVAEGAPGRERKGKVESALQFEKLFEYGFSLHEIRPFPSGSSEGSISGKENPFFKASNGQKFLIFQISEVRDIVSQNSQPPCKFT